MVAFRTGRVDRILSDRPGLQRVEIDGERAYALTDLIGPVAIGDEVVVNTTAVDLGLGTGGWHVVHWNLSRRSWEQPGPGHVMKLRYTSLQADTGVVDEEHPDDDRDLEGVPVVTCGLHSMVPVVVAAMRAVRPDARIGYVMTDDGALPLALSDLVADLVAAGLVDATLTSGHAFGGDLECATVPSALWHGRHTAACDLLVVAMGPGNVGTSTRLGSTALNQVGALDAAARLGGRPVLALRASSSDPRPRHRGISEHTLAVLELVGQPVLVAVPPSLRAATATLVASLPGPRPELTVVEPPDVLAILAGAGIDVTSMGRRIADDHLFVAAAASAGRAAAELP